MHVVSTCSQTLGERKERRVRTVPAPLPQRPSAPRQRPPGERAYCPEEATQTE